MTSEMYDWMLRLDESEPDFYVEHEDVSLKTLRRQNPPTCDTDSPDMVPPERKDTHRETAKAAARSAVNGYVLALQGKDPKMVAARTAQAIAVAASTSRTHAAFVAAATAVESAALLYVEDSRNGDPHGMLKALTKHAINAAVDAALRVDDGNDSTATASPPFNDRDASVSQQLQPPLVPEVPPFPEILPDTPLPSTPLPSPPRPSPRPRQTRGPETEWPTWTDIMFADFLIFMAGYLIPFASGLGLGRAILSGTVMAVFFGILLIRAYFAIHALDQ